MILIATTFAVFSIQSAFILITFIFVGAVGVVTVAISAVFRFVPKEIPINKLWIAPTILTMAVLSFTIYKYASYGISAKDVNIAEFQTRYVIAVVFLVSLMVLLMVSIVKLVRREEVCSK
jgi:NADH-quinone oxidoreductase subunit J